MVQEVVDGCAEKELPERKSGPGRYRLAAAAALAGGAVRVGTENAKKTAGRAPREMILIRLPKDIREAH